MRGATFERGNIKQYISIILIAISPCLVDAGLILTPGQSFEFEFNSMAVSGGGAGASAGFFCGSDNIQTGDSVIFSVFEDNTSQSPISSPIPFIGSDMFPNGYWGGIISLDGALPWQDQQGVLRIEVVSGSIELNELFAQTHINGQTYFVSSVVPEPSAILLFGIGACGVWLLRRNKQHYTSCND